MFVFLGGFLNLFVIVGFLGKGREDDIKSRKYIKSVGFGGYSAIGLEGVLLLELDIWFLVGFGYLRVFVRLFRFCRIGFCLV